MTQTPGSWNSPITAKLLTTAATHLWGVQTVGADVLWGEMRPTESGRVTIVSKKHGVLLPAPWDASSSVHEYGGTAWLGYEANNSLKIAFVNKSDQRLYSFEIGHEPVALTPDTNRSHRYLEMIFVDGEIWCLREIVAQNGQTTRDLIAVSADGIRILDNKSHFYAYLSLSPDKKHASFIGWEHPQMPWDGTELFVVDIENGAFTNRRVLDGSRDCSVLHPIWADDEKIYYISDESGWWNPWQVEISGIKKQLVNESSEWAGPIWTLGEKFLALTNHGKILAVHGLVDNQKLTILDPETGMYEDIATEFNHFEPYFAIAADLLYVVCAGSTVAQALIQVNLTTREVTETLFKTEVSFDPKYLTTPYQIEVPGKDGRKVLPSCTPHIIQITNSPAPHH